MYDFPLHLVSAKPEQIHVYDTILNPYDNYIWGFTFLCIGAQFTLLRIMQYLWSQISGDISSIDYIYEGDVTDANHFWSVQVTIFLSRFFPLYRTDP